MNFGTGVLAAVVLMIVPGAVVARAGGLRWPLATAVGPALTYGVVSLAIVPFGAIGVRWNALTALMAWAAMTGLAFGLRIMLGGPREGRYDRPAQDRGPEWAAAAGVLLGALAIGYAMLLRRRTV